MTTTRRGIVKLTLNRQAPPPIQTPLADRLIRHADAAFGEEIFDISEAQAESVIERDGVTDDFRRESVSAVAGRLAHHTPTLPPWALT